MSDEILPNKAKTTPYTREQQRRFDRVYEYMAHNRLTLSQVYGEIQNKICKLSRGDRDYVIGSMVRIQREQEQPDSQQGVPV